MHGLQAAVIGTGFIGPVHIEALRRLGVNVRGVLGSSPDKSRAAAARLGVDTGYVSLDALLADEQVDVVHVASPNDLHYEQSAAALRAGKHVMCEKPLAMNAQETASLVALAAERELAAGVNYNIRFYPVCVEARERARSGALGEVWSVVGSYVQDWLTKPTDYNWRVLAHRAGALRAVADIGTHWLDLLLHISGLEVDAVMADLSTVHPTRRRPVGEVETFAGPADSEPETEPVDIDTEDHGSVLLRFRGGARGNLWVSQTTPGRKNCLRFEIAGSGGALAWNSETPNELWMGARDEPNALLLRDPALLSGTAAGHASLPGGHNEGFHDTFKECFRAFYDHVASGAPAEDAAYPTFADGHREVALCEAILRSHREQRWVATEGDDA
jgi:predicted dehydrogenase